MNKAIFFDRDGTITVDTGYPHKVKDLKFQENAIPGLKLIQNSGYKLIIVTNQSGIGRGYYTEQDYHAFMEELYFRLKKERINFDGEYFCPHISEDNCNCRKPNIGMLEKAVLDHDIDLQESWVIGDKTSDIELGRRAGCKTILVRTGNMGRDGNFNTMPNHISDNLLNANLHILSQNV